MNKTDVFVVTAILAQAVAPHDIPLLFALLATFALLRGGLLVATRRSSSNMRVLRSLFATFASVAWLIVCLRRDTIGWPPIGIYVDKVVHDQPSFRSQ